MDGIVLDIVLIFNKLITLLVNFAHIINVKILLLNKLKNGVLG